MTELLLILATWRVTYLLSTEAAPFELAARFRHLIGVRYNEGSKPYATNELAKMVLCPFCLSVWIAPLMILAWMYAPIVVWIAALSAGSIVVHIWVKG